MPSSFTARIESGEVTTVQEFATDCAHGFFHDVGLETPLAEVASSFGSGSVDYHAGGLAEAEQRLAEVSVWTEEDATEAARRYNQDNLKGYLSHVRNNRDMMGRYGAMAVQVDAWEPPTEDHQGLKDVMVSQIQESTRGYTRPVERPEKIDGSTLRAQEIEDAQQDVARHTERLDEANAERSKVVQWVVDLETSFGVREPVSSPA